MEVSAVTVVEKVCPLVLLSVCVGGGSESEAD